MANKFKSLKCWDSEHVKKFLAIFKNKTNWNSNGREMED